MEEGELKAARQAGRAAAAAAPPGKHKNIYRLTLREINFSART